MERVCMRGHGEGLHEGHGEGLHEGAWRGST